MPTRALYRAEPLTEKLDEVFGKVRTLGDPDLLTLLLVVLHNTKTDSAWPLSNCTQAKYNRADRYLLDEPDRNLDLSLIELLRGSTAAPVYLPTPAGSSSARTSSCSRTVGSRRSTTPPSCCS